MDHTSDEIVVMVQHIGDAMADLWEALTLSGTSDYQCTLLSPLEDTPTVRLAADQSSMLIQSTIGDMVSTVQLTIFGRSSS